MIGRSPSDLHTIFLSGEKMLPFVFCEIVTTFFAPSLDCKVTDGHSLSFSASDALLFSLTY